MAPDLLRNISPPSQLEAGSTPPTNMTGRLDVNVQGRLHPDRQNANGTARHAPSRLAELGANSVQRPPIGVVVRDFAVEVVHGQSARTLRRPRQQRIAAPGPASPQIVLYINGGGKKAPTYISPSKFFAEHGEEHGVERPPAYITVAPSIPAAAQFMPKDKLDEDAYDMQMEGRRDQFGARQTHVPSSIPAAQNGVGGRGRSGSDGRGNRNRNRRRT
ncbi:hypothetical protein N431DRAFT_435117 [Stipitochalara longipes BDJ]|nr:hypothetical protein N431DRAFT_435117 [Stipitochalara longipes BDJ]